jgi:simple sugar transport system ATP-binding protein
MSGPPAQHDRAEADGADTTPVLSCSELTKSYGHVDALRGVTLGVHAGEIFAVFGDNGAGKSTLLKSLCGIVRPDSGTIMIRGERIRFDSIRDAHRFGVDVVYQDLALPPHLGVHESMFLGHEVMKDGWRGRLGILDRRKMGADTRRALEALGINLPSVTVPVQMLSGGQRQAVAVARAEKWASSVILMDEPTAALGTKQSQIVTETIIAAAEHGLAVFVISHDIPRLLQVATTVAVMRHGRLEWTRPAQSVNVTDVVTAMVGQVGDPDGD